MLGLVNFLIASGVEVDVQSLKIHLACWNGREHPIDVYYDGRFKSWQEWQNQRNFKCSNVLSLIDLGNSHWLYVGVYKVHNCKPNPQKPSCFLYSTELLPKQNDLVARIIVRHKRTRASYIWYKPELELPIVEIRREKMTVGPVRNLVSASSNW